MRIVSASPALTADSSSAARRAFSGHGPPARSAIARSGRQLSAARSFSSAGTAGSASRRARAESAAQRAAFLPSSCCAPTRSNSEPRNPFVGTPPPHLNDDASILDRARQSADRSYRDRTPGRKDSRLVIIADKPDNLPVARVAGVDDAAQLLVIFEERVGLIDQKRRPSGLDRSEHGRDSDVGGAEGLGQHRMHHPQKRALAAALLRRNDRQSGRDVERLEGVGVNTPQCACDRRSRGERDIVIDRLHDRPD